MSELDLDAIRERLAQAVAPVSSMRQDIRALLVEVERLQQAIINERYAARLEAENAARLQEQLDGMATAQRERQWE